MIKQPTRLNCDGKQLPHNYIPSHPPTYFYTFSQPSARTTFRCAPARQRLIISVRVCVGMYVRVHARECVCVFRLLAAVPLRVAIIVTEYECKSDRGGEMVLPACTVVIGESRPTSHPNLLPVHK